VILPKRPHRKTPISAEERIKAMDQEQNTNRRINLNQYDLPWPWNKTVGIREWLRARGIMHETAWLSVLACAVIVLPTPQQRLSSAADLP
jgi:hypothetical protein